MKYTLRDFTLFFFCTLTLVLCFSSACAANCVLISAQAPAIITTPDYIDPFQAPSPSGLPGQLFRSKEGFVFSFDASGRRVYLMHASYVLSAHGDPVPVHSIAAPMIAVHPGAVLTSVSSYPPQQYVLAP